MISHIWNLQRVRNSFPVAGLNLQRFLRQAREKNPALRTGQLPLPMSRLGGFVSAFGRTGGGGGVACFSLRGGGTVFATSTFTRTADFVVPLTGRFAAA